MQGASFILAINVVLSCVFMVRGETYGRINSPRGTVGVVTVDEAFEVDYTLTRYSSNPVKIIFDSFDNEEGDRVVTLNSTFQSIGTHSVIIRHLLVAENSSSIDSVSPKLPLLSTGFYELKTEPSLSPTNEQGGLAFGSIILKVERCGSEYFIDDRNDYACTRVRTCLPGSYVSAKKNGD